MQSSAVVPTASILRFLRRPSGFHVHVALLPACDDPVPKPEFRFVKSSVAMQFKLDTRMETRDKRNTIPVECSIGALIPLVHFECMLVGPQLLHAPQPFAVRPLSPYPLLHQIPDVTQVVLSTMLYCA